MCRMCRGMKVERKRKEAVVNGKMDIDIGDG